MNLKVNRKTYWIDLEKNEVYNKENGQLKGKLRNQDKINELLQKARNCINIRKPNI